VEQSTQLYLIATDTLPLSNSADQIAKALDTVPIACLRYETALTDEAEVIKAADVLREIAHARDVPLLITDHYRLVEMLGLDGVHLSTHTNLREVRAALARPAIVGAHCGVSRHDGLTGAEIGADYISFGPLQTSALGSDACVEPDLFDWWSQMIEVPVVAQGSATPEMVESLSGVADFVALGDEIWRQDDPIAALAQFSERLQG
jgi:thiamine-phosphate pyrophosphorylase